MSALAHKEKGNGFFKEKKWRPAIEEYSKGLSDTGVAPDVRGLLLSNRSQCWLNLEEWQQACDDASACLRLLPEHSKSLFRRGQALEKLGKEGEALKDYVLVAKAEPSNAAAVQASQRLRERVLRADGERRDVLLPTNLNKDLQSSDPAVAEEACQKLRALCIQKGYGRSLLQAGSLEALVQLASAEETAPEVRAAALSALVALASGREAEEEEDIKRPVGVNEKLEVPPSAADSRKRLRSQLKLLELRRFCKPHAAALRQLALLLGYIYEPEDLDALHVLDDALAFVQGSEELVPRAGLVGLVMILDTRRRAGAAGQPVVTSAPLLKCLESAMGTTCNGELLRTLMTTIFALWSDKDRPKSKEVDVAEVAGKVIEPFLQVDDMALKSNGLAGLEALFVANSEAATQVLHSGRAALEAILQCMSKAAIGADARRAQGHATECLLLATGTLKTRQYLISAGGIDMLLAALEDGEQGSKGVVRAKLVAVLALMAAHNAEVREEVFDRIDLLMELRFALDTAREEAQAAPKQSPDGDAKDSAAKKEESRRLLRALFESCAFLTMHGEFKKTLAGSKKTLGAMQKMARPEDLAEDAQLAFHYATLTYNLCRSREDKPRVKKNEFPFNELDQDDIQALEEFYEKMPAEARPAKNGEVDFGSKEVAKQMREYCIFQGAEAAKSGAATDQHRGSVVVMHLAKCAASTSPRARNLVAFVFKHLCEETQHRSRIVSSGGFRALLGLVDVEEEAARDAARQALAQICIVTNPVMFSYSEQLDAIRPLVQLLDNKHELLQFEGALGLTNLLIVSEEVRTRAVQGDAWRACRDLLFSENEMVQRAGMEALCNLTMAPEVVERFTSATGDNDLKILLAFVGAEDLKMQVAATGALAMLAAYELVIPRIAATDNFENVAKVFSETTSEDVEHRAAVVLGNVADFEGEGNEVSEAVVAASARARAALRKKLKAGRCVSEAGKAQAQAVVDEATAGA